MGIELVNIQRDKYLAIPSTCEYSNLVPVGEHHWYRSICYNKVVAFSVGIVNPEVEFSTDRVDTKITMRYVCSSCALELDKDLIPTINILTGEFLYLGIFGTRTPDDIIRKFYQGEY